MDAPTLFRAVWSPDGSSIAFITGGALFVARPDGSERRQVAEGGVLAVDWSPDGSRLALVGLIPMQNRLEVVRPDGTDRRVLTATVGTDGKVAWSPDSTRLGYLDYDRGPVVIDVATGAVVALTTQRNLLWRVSWSPAGDEVAFADYVWSSSAISVARADGSGVRTLATGAVAPAWSPNGARIAFQGNRSPDGRGELLTHLYVIDRTGGGERVVVADTRSTHVDEPSWAPDSIRIAFSFAA
jgi:Tol biopolymer transport system component